MVFCTTPAFRAVGTPTTGASAPWAQQPQVTQVGGHAPSSGAPARFPTQGSGNIKVVRPDALNVSSATTRIRAKRRTMSIVASGLNTGGFAYGRYRNVWL